MQLREPIEHLAPAWPRDAVGVLQVQHRVLAAAKLHALVNAGQEPVSPEPRVKRLINPVLGNEDNKGRKIFVRAAESIAEPGAHAGAAGELGAGLEKRDGRVVVDRFGVHRSDETQLVHHLCCPGQQLAYPRAALAVLPEFEKGTGHRQRRLKTRHAGEPLSHAHLGGKVFAVALV